jgi:hypothetical protein
MCHIHVRVGGAAPYLIAVTSSSLVGHGPGIAAFYRVDRVALLPFEGLADAPALSKLEQRDEQHFVSLLQSIFRTRSFYFATNFEITHTAQSEWPCRAHPSVLRDAALAL